MRTRLNLMASAFAAAALAFTATAVLASGQDEDGNFCMDVDLGPFHMVPGFMTDEGACAVQEYLGGWLQETFYPFTIEDHQFNCEVFGDLTPLPQLGDDVFVPSSVKSEGDITGTIGGHPFKGTLFCASQTNWYADFCPDPFDKDKPCFQLAQPFFDLVDREPYSRVTEVSVFDGVIAIQKGKGKKKEVPVVMATRAAGITHLEGLYPPQVGASITHSLLGLVTYEADEDGIEPEVLSGSLDMLLQGHIFFPDTVENDPAAARVRGAICSKDLYQMLNGKGKKKGRDDD